MASPGLRKELECSIYLNLYTDPVTLICGHNFCRVCIDQVLNTQDGSGVYFCSECRAEFQERPVLIKNITLCNVVERVTALFIDIRRRLVDLEKRVLHEISRQEEQRSLSLSDVIHKLEIKKAELSRKMRHVEELCNMTDPLTVLQDPDTGDLCPPESSSPPPSSGSHDGGDKDTGGHDGSDRGVELISLISHTLSDIIRGVNVTFYVQDPSDILLDVKTAAEDICKSDDLKTASFRGINRNLPETVERFENNQVVSSSKISSGRHYWDVETSGSVDWIVGVCYFSIARRGRRSHIGESDKSWGLYVDGYSNRFSVRHDGKEIWLPHPISIYKVRIYVDYEAGQLSFYELCDPIRHLYSFIPNFSATFNEPLLTGFAICGGYIKILGKSSCEK